MNRAQEARAINQNVNAMIEAKAMRRAALKANARAKKIEKEVQDAIKKGDMQKARTKAQYLLSWQSMQQTNEEIADMAENAHQQSLVNQNMVRLQGTMTRMMGYLGWVQKQANPEKALIAAEEINAKNEELNQTRNIYKEAMSNQQATQVSDESVTELIAKLADDAGVELSGQLNEAQPVTEDPQPQTVEKAKEVDPLEERLRALRA